MPRIASTTGRGLTILRPKRLALPEISVPMIINVLVNEAGVSSGNYLKIGKGANVVVDWGDGTVETIVNPSDGFFPLATHQYAETGTYTITIDGFLPQFGRDMSIGIGEGFGQDFIQEVVQWNSTTTDFAWAFEDEDQLIAVPGTLPQGVTNTRGMFIGATILNQDISQWDVSGVTDTSFMFFRARTFNQDIGSWNVSNVTNMQSMFTNATAFNQDISSWDVSNVTNMDFMFTTEASFPPFPTTMAFNQDLSNWCVTNIPQEPVLFAEGAPNWLLPKPVWGTCPTSLSYGGIAEITDQEINYSVTTSNYQFGYFDTSGGPGNFYLQLQTTDPYLRSLNPGDVIQINFESIPSITITVTVAFFNAGALGGQGEWLISFTTSDDIPQSSELQTSMQIFKTRKFYVEAPFGTADSMFDVLSSLDIGTSFEWTSIYSPDPNQRYPAVLLSSDLIPGGEWSFEIGTVLNPIDGSYGTDGWEINRIFIDRSYL